MINVLNIIKKKLMVSIFLGAMSVSAMSMDSSSDKEAANCMKIAHSALDMAHAKKANNVRDDICCMALERNDRDMHVYLKELTIQALREIAKENLVRALELHSPHAAIVLYSNFSDDKDAPNQLISALEQSISFKKAQPDGDPHRSRLREDAYALMTLKRLLVYPLMERENMERIEEIDEEIAIGIYGKYTYEPDFDSENPQAEIAIKALTRLQENPSTWIYLSNVYFKCRKLDRGLEYIQKIMDQSKEFEYRALRLLEDQVANTEVALPMRLEMAKLASQHAHQWNPGKPESFSTHFEYYGLLHKMEEQDRTLRGDEIIKVGALLADIAEKDFDRGRPDLLTRWADVLESDVKRAKAHKEYDFDPIIDMLIRAVNAGSNFAVVKLADMPQFIDSPRHIEQVTTFFVQNGKTSGLLNLYNKYNNSVFLEILTLMSENQEKWVKFNVADVKKTKDLRDQLSNSYIPKIGLEIYTQSYKVSEIVRSIKFANRSIQSAEKNSAYSVSSSPIALVARLTGNDGQIGYQDLSLSEARKFIEQAVDKTKNMQREIETLSARKETLVDSLTAQGLFNMASDYNLLYRVAEVMSDDIRQELFLKEHLSMLGRASNKSYLPAIKNLASYYANGFSKRNYSRLGFQNEESILQNPELGIKYGIDSYLTENLYPLLSSDNEFLQTNPFNNILSIIKEYIAV